MYIYTNIFVPGILGEGGLVLVRWRVRWRRPSSTAKVNGGREREKGRGGSQWRIREKEYDAFV